MYTKAKRNVTECNGGYLTKRRPERAVVVQVSLFRSSECMVYASSEIINSKIKVFILIHSFSPSSKL